MFPVVVDPPGVEGRRDREPPEDDGRGQEGHGGRDVDQGRGDLGHVEGVHKSLLPLMYTALKCQKAHQVPSPQKSMVFQYEQQVVNYCCFIYYLRSMLYGQMLND